MHTTYGANNYNSSEGLLVWYEQEKVVTPLGDSKVRVTRHATKRYSFVCMTKDAATACAAAKVAQYTRFFYDDTTGTQSTIDEEKNKKLKTEITTSVNEDGSRTVSISVNETDVRIVSPSSGSLYVEDPESIFPLANARNYDESVLPHKTTQGLSYYSKRKNQAIESDLTVEYDVEKQVGYSIFTRYAKKVFSYVGMRQAVAESCAKSKISQYTRDYCYITSSAATIAAKNSKAMRNGASVSLLHDGIMWAVKVSVNETDVKAAATGTDPASVFTEENARAYDDESDLDLASVTLRAPLPGETEVDATVVAVCRLPGKTLADCTLEYRIGDAMTWIEAEVTWGTSGGIATMPVTDQDIFCRLTCDYAESDTIMAE